MVPNLPIEGKEMSIQVSNNTAVIAKIIGIHISWPEPPNGNLDKVKFDGNEIYGFDDPPEAWIDSSTDPTYLPGFTSHTLTFFFPNDVAPTGYWIELWFSVSGCSTSGGA